MNLKSICFRHFFVGAVSLGLCAIGACRTKHSESTGAASGAPVAASANAGGGVIAGGSGSAGSPVAAPSFDRAAVQAFVTRWEAAQNKHDFEAYGALYAERFTGLKRVGSFSKRFDRKGWLKDRKPMFRDGVSVHVSELQLSGGAEAVRAVFVQDFVAPGFHDSGKKELFLALGPSGISISREEMLASAVAPMVKSDVLAFQRDGVMIEQGVEVDALGERPRLLSTAENVPYVVAISVSPTEVHAPNWVGRQMTVYDKDGSVCQGTISRLELRVNAVPHFGLRDTWAGKTGEPKLTDAQIAATIWEMARSEERFLVGVLDKECHGVWASEHALPFIRAQAASAPMRAAALAAFKALPQYHELQDSFVEQASDHDHAWETVEGELTVSEVRSSPETALVVVSARAGSGCGNFFGKLTGIWAANGAGTPQLALRGVLGDGNGLTLVHGAVDENSDGALELLTGPEGGDEDVISVLRAKSQSYERSVLLATSFWDCGC